ncbi:DUF2690 domain-containing protein [Actinosynnema sp. NPDC059335]|uniref:DUF2690 domain-containing protein n=1 Tax=Actinosynnema sp. NPDC059335 TaxID=3346804 RepID=UPI003671A1C7
MPLIGRRSLSAVVVAAALAVLAPSPASAAPYDPYTDTNPQTTGCAADAVTIASRDIKSPQAVHGLMEVRYSPTCGTNWVRATVYVTQPTGTVVKGIRRPSSQPDGHGGWLGFYEQRESDPAVGATFGMQVYAPGSTCVFAMAEIRDSTGQVVASTGTSVPYYDPWVPFC